MKRFNLRKLLMLFALVIIVQNGTIIIHDTGADTGSYSEENTASPCSDLPSPNDNRT